MAPPCDAWLCAPSQEKKIAIPCFCLRESRFVFVFHRRYTTMIRKPCNHMCHLS